MLTIAEAVAGNHRVIANEIERKKEILQSSLFRHDITNSHRLITRWIDPDSNPNKNVSTRMLTTAEAVAGNHRVIAKEIERKKEILQSSGTI